MKGVYLQYTSWEEMPVEVQGVFVECMGGDAHLGQAFYELYFYWYNIAHELGHVLRRRYGAAGSSQWGEEMAVNELAVAYWHARGEAQWLAQLREWVAIALSRLPDPVPPGQDPIAYFDSQPPGLSSPPVYGHYQFSMVLAALARPLGLADALRAHVTPQARPASIASASPAPAYAAVQVDLPARIVADMRACLRAFGVELPELRVVRAYSPALQFVNWDWP